MSRSRRQFQKDVLYFFFFAFQCVRPIYLSVSRTSFNISPFPVIWCYETSSGVPDEKLRSRANGCEKLLSQAAVCVPQLILEVKCKLMATLNSTIPKCSIPISLLKQRMVCTIVVALSLIVSLCKPHRQEKAQLQQS